MKSSIDVLSRAAAGLFIAVALAPAQAAVTFYVHGSWPSEQHRQDAVSAMTAATNRYNDNDFTGFDKVIQVYYNASVPTANGSYNGTINFGGTYPNERVSLHEIGHTLGIGTTWQYGNLLTGGTWDGPLANCILRQFDGEQAVLRGDGAHIYSYGMNYDNEYSGVNAERHVALLHAMRADMGIGPFGHPSTARTVTLTASDPYGESGFNYNSRWSDGYFPHDGATYFTDDFVMRTPQSPHSFVFAGATLTLNGSGPDSGLYFKGEGSGGVIAFPNLLLDGGWVDHRGTYNLADLFQLDGKVTVASDSAMRALNGNIHVLADVAGSATLTIPETANPNENNRYVRFFSSNNTFTGDLLVDGGRFELAPGANLNFVIGGAGENNAILGDNARRVALNGAFEVNLANASTTPGDSWALSTAANTLYGSNFEVVGFNEAVPGLWTNGHYMFSETSGMLSVTLPGDFNGDTLVNSADLNLWQTGFGTATGAILSDGDANADGAVDGADFLLWQRNLGGGSVNAVAAIPEPTAAALLLLAASLAGLLTPARRAPNC